MSSARAMLAFPSSIDVVIMQLLASLQQKIERLVLAISRAAAARLLAIFRVADVRSGSLRSQGSARCRRADLKVCDSKRPKHQV